MATCSATNEAALWSVKHDQPIVILDEPSSTADNSLQLINYAKVKNTGFLVCTSSEEVALYAIPQESSKTSVVKACDSRVSLGLLSSTDKI